MGKYMRKSKTKGGEVAVMEPYLGVRTRAKTLALQRLQSAVTQQSTGAAAGANSAGGGSSFLQLRRRRMEKSPIAVDSKRAKQCPKGNLVNSKRNLSPELKVGGVNSGLVRSGSIESGNKEKGRLGTEKRLEEEIEAKNSADLGVDAAFGENVLEFEGTERNTRESTPCSLIRDPDTIKTTGSTTRPTSANEAHQRVQNVATGHIPTAHEVDEFFADAEDQQQKHFMEKYNFDPVNNKPLPGRYEWEKLKP